MWLPWLAWLAATAAVGVCVVGVVVWEQDSADRYRRRDPDDEEEGVPWWTGS